MGKGLIDSLLDHIFDADWTGRRGEKLTERELNLVWLFGRGGKVLRNIYVPKDNGETSEIDVLFITQKGIFVIESKNYSGWIFGDEKAAYWTAMLPNKEKKRFYNPIKQNKTHIKWLGQYLKEEIPLFSVIVFSERCELKKITVESPNIPVIKRDRLYAVVRNIWENAEDKLDPTKLDEIYTKLELLTHAGQSVKLSHIENIQSRYQKAESPQYSRKTEPAEYQENNQVCPRCGGKLILRTAKKGANAGNHFYGCSNFPKCRYVCNAEE
ncbi:MAG: NERD domain-containing protein [Clostridium sp.]|nr:NERD domain-containing protein [Clostridium sp.]